MRSLILLLAVSLFGASAFSEEPRAKHVFIISLDQGSPDILRMSKMPVLWSMVAEGAHTWEAYTIVPSITLPSHVSMLSGVGIQKHQVLWNDLNPSKGFIKVPNVFSIAKKNGLKTAMYVGKAKFKSLAMPGTLDAFAAVETGSPGVAKAFAAQVGTLKPNVCLIHFPDPDTTGHKFGVYSQEKMDALAECDLALKIILDAIEAAGLKDSSVIIITADHGGHDRSAKENEERKAKGEPYQPGTHGSAETVDVTIPWIAWGKGVKKDYTITKAVVTYDTAATALWLLGIPLPDDFWGRPVTSAFE